METPFDEYMATFSPDGRFLAYQSDESGRDEVYVRAFPGPGGRWQVSTEGGTEPRWSGNGSEIFYRARRRLYAVKIDTSAGFSAGRPQPIADGLPSGGNPVTYSVSHDGRYVYFIKDLGSGNRVDRATLLLNWADEVARLVAK
jgi:Tol biopolymer transport system component